MKYIRKTLCQWKYYIFVERNALFAFLKIRIIINSIVY